MKSFILVIVLVCCFFIGYYIKKYYYLKKEFYKNLCMFIESLINNINFNNKKLNIFVSSEKDKLKGYFNNFLEIYEDYLTNRTTKEKFFLNFKKIFYFLNLQELNEVFAFLVCIGEKTKEEEIEFLNNNLIRLKEKSIKTKQSYDKYANLFLKLFIILGILIFIIFF